MALFCTASAKVCNVFLCVSFFTDCKLIRKTVQCCVKWQTCCNLNIMIIYDLFADTIYMLFFIAIVFVVLDVDVCIVVLSLLNTLL